jgi:hypothetical protein
MTDDELPHDEAKFYVPRNVVSFMADMFTQDPAFQEQLEQFLKDSQILAQDGWRRLTMPALDPLADLGNLDDAIRRMVVNSMWGRGGFVVVQPGTPTAQATAPTPTVRTSFTAGGSSPAEPKRGPLAGLSPSQKMTLVLVLLWVVAYFLPLAQMALPEVYQTLLTDAAAWWGIALAITFAILANRK